MTSGGAAVAGNAARVVHADAHGFPTNAYTVVFARDLTGCIPTATPAVVQSGSTVERPEPGRIIVRSAISGAPDMVVVETYGADGTPAEQPFNVIVAC